MIILLYAYFISHIITTTRTTIIMMHRATNSLLFFRCYLIRPYKVVENKVVRASSSSAFGGRQTKCWNDAKARAAEFHSNGPHIYRQSKRTQQKVADRIYIVQQSQATYLSANRLVLDGTILGIPCVVRWFLSRNIWKCGSFYSRWHEMIQSIESNRIVLTIVFSPFKLVF